MKRSDGMRSRTWLLKSQYGHFERQKGQWTYRASGSVTSVSVACAMLFGNATWLQMATFTPSSTTRSIGIRKNSVAGVALRDMKRKRDIRQRDILGMEARVTSSREMK